MISKNEIRSRARAFSKEWELDDNEDAEAKSFWDGFFEVFGVARRRVATFEKRVKKADGHDGYIDVFWKGTMLAEHKSKGKDLSKAFIQAKSYIPGIKDEDLPRYLILSDFQRMRVYDLETKNDKEFQLSDLHKNIGLFDFISGYTTDIDYEKEEEVSIKAARLMASFHNEIASTGYAGHDLEVFLTRILFCLFADDTDIFEKNTFRRYIETRTRIDGSDLGLHIQQIFQVLSTPEDKRQLNLDEQLASFPYINGGIFKETIPIVSFEGKGREALITCATFNWSEISASIFGSLFQGVMDEKSRRSLGAHYTSERNIMKVVHPLFLDELYIEFDQVKNNKKKLDDFHNKLSTLTFLDPACGCGNFLVVTYRELRKLELDILEKKNKSGQMMLIGTEDLSRINVNQLYGIEIEEFPSLVARTALYLVDHQMNNELSKKFGIEYKRLPLRESATIIHDDALVVDWETIISKDKLNYILGNPPFVGAMVMDDTQHNSLNLVFGKDIKNSGILDFVTAWYEKASRYMMGTAVKSAFVSTNSICQGEQVGILWKRLKEKYGVVIHFAHQTFKWNNDAPGVAGVYCIIAGFATFDVPKKYLYEYETIKSEPREKEVSHINAYLVVGEDTFLENKKTPLCDAPLIIFGNMPRDGGHLLLTDKEKEDLIKNEPLAIKWIRPFISAKEFLNNENRWCLWLAGIEPQELKNLPHVLERVEAVRIFRLASKAISTRNFAKTSSLFAQSVQPDNSYVLIPRHSSENREYIPMGFFSSNDIVADSCMAVVGAELYHP